MKETLAQVFSSEFCEISKNSFFHRTPLVAAFDFKWRRHYALYIDKLYTYKKVKVFLNLLKKNLQRWCSHLKCNVNRHTKCWSSRQEVFCKKRALRNCHSLFLNKVGDLRVFHRTPLVAASVNAPWLFKRITFFFLELRFSVKLLLLNTLWQISILKNKETGSSIKHIDF